MSKIRLKYYHLVGRHVSNLQLLLKEVNVVLRKKNLSTLWQMQLPEQEQCFAVFRNEDGHV